MSLNYIPRVTQLDAIHLDNQLEELFKQQLLLATQYFEPGVLQPILPELELLLRTWIFKNSVYNKKCTFGQEMLSLFYVKDNISRSKLWWYYGYMVGLKYVRDRALYSFTSNVKVQRFIHSLETFQLIGDLLNFLSFIQRGKYPLLVDFILGLEISAAKLTREDLSDLSWTRELLWHNFIELIGTVISLLNIFGLKRRLSNILKYVWWKKPVKNGPVSSVATMDVRTLCAVCSSKPVIPHTMGCSHIFCFYCLMANKAADKDFPCPECSFNGNQITKFTLTS